MWKYNITDNHWIWVSGQLYMNGYDNQSSSAVI